MSKLFALRIGHCKLNCKKYIVGLALSLVVALALIMLPKQAQQLEVAREADSFVNSIGINTHLSYNDTPYGQYDTLIKPRLKELGIRHIRDGNAPNSLEYYAKLRDLVTMGIRCTLIEGIGWVTPEQAVAIAKQLGSAQEAAEAPNEYDNGTNASQWFLRLREYVQQLHEAFKKDSTTADIKIVGPSFVQRDSSLLVGDLSQWVDYGNMHPYNYPNNPGDSNIRRELAYRPRPFSDKPMMATETGYHTGGDNSDRSISEIAQGKYLPRLFLEYFNHKIVRTFSYELIDERLDSKESEANFGILRHNGLPKPAFFAIKNLIFLLKDQGSKFQPHTLNYSLSKNTADVHHTLLQKRDGRFYLILWLEVPSFNHKTNKDILVPAQLVTLNLNTPIREVAIYQPMNSIAPIYRQKRVKKLSLSVPDYPVAIELVPNK